MQVSNSTNQTVVLTASGDDWQAAWTEASNRQPFMLNKRDDGDAAHFDRIFYGLQIEHTVRSYCRDRFPHDYLPPTNEGKWETICGHDFQLDLGWRTATVDVAGTNRGPDGTFNGWGAVARKPSSDFHICVSAPWPNPARVTIEGWLPGLEFKRKWHTADELCSWHLFEHWMDHDCYGESYPQTE